MNNDVKIAKFYNGSKMRRAIMLMEQFWLLSQDESLDNAMKVCAKSLFEHYRRLAMCILMKEMPEKLVDELVIDVDYMKKMYQTYTETP